MVFTKENKIRYSQCSPPYDNFFIGSAASDGVTEEFDKTIDVYINVSDSPTKFDFSGKSRWFPINEVGYWGYAPFFWAKKILDDCHERKLRTYIHCHAGVCRSPLIFYTWLLSKGLSESAAGIMKFNISNMYLNHVKGGHIPSNLMEMYKRIENNPATYALGGIIGGEIPIERTKEVRVEYDEFEDGIAPEKSLVQGWMENNKGELNKHIGKWIALDIKGGVIRYVGDELKDISSRIEESKRGDYLCMEVTEWITR